MEERRRRRFLAGGSHHFVVEGPRPRVPHGQQNLSALPISISIKQNHWKNTRSRLSMCLCVSVSVCVSVCLCLCVRVPTQKSLQYLIQLSTVTAIGWGASDCCCKKVSTVEKHWRPGLFRFGAEEKKNFNTWESLYNGATTSLCDIQHCTIGETDRRPAPSFLRSGSRSESQRLFGSLLLLLASQPPPPPPPAPPLRCSIQLIALLLSLIDHYSIKVTTATPLHLTPSLLLSSQWPPHAATNIRFRCSESAWK